VVRDLNLAASEGLEARLGEKSVERFTEGPVVLVQLVRLYIETRS
jgi:hypothetical protein